MEPPARLPRPQGRRRSVRLALELPLTLSVGGASFTAQTLLVNRDGVLVRSPQLFPRGTRVEVLNPANGESLATSVVWAWVEGRGEGKTIRLALERSDPGRVPWADAYERALEHLGSSERERRRHPRRSVRVPLEVLRAGSTQEAETFDVSERGAGVVTAGPLEPGMLLRLVRPEQALHAQGRVVWVQPATPDATRRVRAGVELVSPPPDFWNGISASA